MSKKEVRQLIQDLTDRIYRLNEVLAKRSTDDYTYQYVSGQVNELENMIDRLQNILHDTEEYD